MTTVNKNTLSIEQKKELFDILKDRFEKNKARHVALDWSIVESKLESESSTKKLWSLYQMEKTGGEPDVVSYNKESTEVTFFDCSEESPKGRRSVCYDRKAQESRKEHKPKNNALDMAAAMGINLLTEQDYKALQKLGNFDTKTSSWIDTPNDIRKLGGALFADFRYEKVFVYHNSAPSYYAARGFRGSLKI